MHVRLKTEEKTQSNTRESSTKKVSVDSIGYVNREPLPMVRLRAKADSPDASEQRFLCPESSTPKAIGGYLFLHTPYRAYLYYTRLFDLYLS